MKNNYLKEKRILLVDDEPDLLDLLISILNENGYFNIKTAGSIQNGVKAAKEFRPEIAILDVMLPDGDGFSLMEELRKWGEYPILFLTAKGENGDKFRGYGLGADDYMVKPFIPQELVYKITAILRRSYKYDAPFFRLAGCQIDLASSEVLRDDGARLTLTAKEHDLLEVLYRSAGKIVTIDLLCETLWGDNPFGYEESLMSHVRRVRKKIEADPSHPVSLLTARGLGYKLITEEV